VLCEGMPKFVHGPVSQVGKAASSFHTSRDSTPIFPPTYQIVGPWQLELRATDFSTSPTTSVL
jgi:hypothetical protein